MINWHVKRCVSKGLIKLQQAPVRRYLYYLTPEGFAEKARLTASYLQVGFNIFRTGRQQYENLFHRCLENGWRNVALFGDNELSELALLVASGVDGLEICGIIDSQAQRWEHGRVMVASSPRQLVRESRGGGGDCLPLFCLC